MRLEHLAARTGCMHPVKPELWAFARLLGEARRATNEGRRALRSDRGRAGNTSVDLFGAFGELFLLELVKALPRSDDAVEYIRKHLYWPEGGGGPDGPDLVFVDDETGDAIGLDVKTYNCMPNYQFFAINAEKHEKLRASCSAYFALCVPKLGRRVAVARLLPHADVDRWEKRSLGDRVSPSHNLAIPAFLRERFAAPPHVPALQADTYAATAIEMLSKKREVRAALLALVPTLALSTA